MKRRKIGRKTAKARVKGARRNAPKGAGVRAAAAKDTDAAQIQRERDEALQQQAATAEILKLISSSPADTQPVLDAIVRSGLKLFPDAAIFIALPDGDKLRAAAFVATDPNRAKMWAHQWPIPLTREYMHSLAFLDRKTVDIPDAREAPPELAVGAKNFLPTGYRALTIMPMMRGRTVIGTLSVVRLAPGPLSDRQVAALKTYATQAVIAIENTRLLNELRQRTDDLSESLEQQTATSAVLKVISSAPGELQPVFDAILKNATRICGAKIGILFRYEGGAYSALAMLGVTPAYAEYLNSSPIRPGPATGLGRVADTKQTIQIVDTQAEHVYAEREPLRVATAELGGARSLLNVPMLKDGILVGAIGIYRQEVRPFTHKQVELVTNFAAQAVIAIENTRVLNELRESLQQQGATSDVLKVISRSTFDLQTVLDALTESAARLCAADIANIWLLDGSACRLAASYQTIESGQKDYLASLPLGPSRGSCVGRTLLDARTVHIHDIRDDPEYELETSRLEGYRTMLGVPLLREGTPIGVIALVRSVRQPFTPQQIELVNTFADQAVIAIGNTRLLNELRESLEQQTATAEVLKIISSSPGDLEPVFNAILANATNICGAKFGTLYLRKDDAFFAAAFHNAPPAFIEARKNKPLRPAPETTLVRAATTKQVVQTLDATKREAYRQGDPFVVAGTDLAGYRTIVSVPMLKDDELIGVISIYRQEVLSFTDKQIDLVKNFADQAVIAIENARLLNELRESLQQQTATADVLKVISSSQGDLTSVFDSILVNATRICEAGFANLTLLDQGELRLRATHGAPAAFAEAVPVNSIIPHQTPVGRVIDTKQLVHIADIQADETYGRTRLAKLAGAHTTLGVPMLRDGQIIGAILIYRQEVREFNDKQIELVRNFAAQAVIAIENARLLNELRESLEQQTATSEVLKVISSSQGNLDPVFQAMLENAVRICDASFGMLFRVKDGLVSAEAMVGVPPQFAEFWRRGPQRPGPRTALGRTIEQKQTVHVADVRTEAAYVEGEPVFVAAVDLGGFRTLVNVPMLKENELIGTFAIYRQEVRPFSDKEIELLSNFAAQAVIAIENARLLNELRQRTDDLSESLEQQTATADVLTVISSSPGTLDPVFSTMLAKATELCGASYSTLWLYEGDGFRTAAIHGDLPPAWIEQWRSGAIYRPSRPDVLLARATEERRPIQVADMRTDPSYLQGDPLPVAGVEIAGIRTLLVVPMSKEHELVGAIAIYRKEVLPFTEKQIELVQNFAAQAVIAIENTRLLNELRESLEQQTATADVLKVISSSPGELEAVFQEMLSNAMRICEGKFGILFEFANGAFRALSSFNLPPAFAEYHNEARVWGPDTGLGRLASTKKTVHVKDAQEGRAFTEGDAGRMAAVELGGVRTFVAVPMLKEGELIGAFIVFRQEVRPFTDKQIELVSNFAAQAVIAIENARLLSELRESLQQQTATADVLTVISSSPGTLDPVFSTMLAKATELCGASYSTLWLHVGDGFRTAAIHGDLPPAWIEQWRSGAIYRPGPGVLLARATVERRPIQVADMRTDPSYLRGDPLPVAVVEIAGIRTLLVVPMFKENEPVGAIAIYRKEVLPFTEKQIELVQNFAAQAVIAIENTRLLNELRESLQQQTATSDVLKVISRSTFDLQTVLQTLVESAARLCDADKTVITRQKDGVFYRAEAYGFSREFMEFVRNIPIAAERGSAFGRALLERRAVHIPDVKDDAEYTLLEGQKLGDYRTVLAVPMLREDAVIGVLSLTRSDVRPFTEKQIELASTFADQAAIAIENVRLFDEVQGRTRELAASLEDLRTTQDRLVQTQKLASLGQLTAGIAHEIKNPLNFVNNFSTISSELVDELQDMLKGLPVDDRARKQIDELTGMLRGNLDKVVQHGKRADGIVKNMLLHSREGSGEHRVVDINTLVEESLNLAYHGARAEKKNFNITLERSLDPAAGEADVFPQDITRVLLNLILNGFYAAATRKAQAGDGFEPALVAATRSLGDRVEIRIRDNGTGIPPDVKEKIFNPFFTTKPSGEGTGLGLSLSHDIVVKQHGGSIEVDTRPGEFTEFRVILPRAGAALAKAE